MLYNKNDWVITKCTTWKFLTHKLSETENYKRQQNYDYIYMNLKHI